MEMITDSDIEDVLDVADYVASCDEAFRLYGAGDLVSPAREEEVWREGDSDYFQLRMPALWVGKYRGTKVIREQSNVTAGHLGERFAKLEIEDLVAGETFTMGDIAISTRLHQWLNLGQEMPPFPNINAWYGRLRARPTFDQVFTLPLT